MPSNTKKLLRDYHDASKRLEAISTDKMPTPETEEEYGQMVAAARELVSRCILSGDPRSFCFLLKELAVVAKIFGQPTVAVDLSHACADLANFYQEFGTF